MQQTRDWPKNKNKANSGSKHLTCFQQNFVKCIQTPGEKNSHYPCGFRKSGCTLLQVKKRKEEAIKQSWLYTQQGQCALSEALKLRLYTCVGFSSQCVPMLNYLFFLVIATTFLFTLQFLPTYLFCQQPPG